MKIQRGSLRRFILSAVALGLGAILSAAPESDRAERVFGCE